LGSEVGEPKNKEQRTKKKEQRRKKKEERGKSRELEIPDIGTRCAFLAFRTSSRQTARAPNDPSREANHV
jgi:hypothetical protein